MLEFSTDSFVRDISEPDVVEILVNNHGTCGFSEVSENGAPEHMARIGDNCVVHSNEKEDQVYILYAPVWIRQGGAIFPHCIQTDDNELVREPAIYTNQNLDVRESSFIAERKGNSYGSNVDESDSFITVVGRNTDIAVVKKQTFNNQTFSTGLLLTRIPNTKITCMGKVFGRFGAGQLKVDLTFCVHGELPYDNRTDFLYLSGSAWIPKDAEFITENWEVKIASTVGREIRDFGKGIVSDTVLRHTAYATFLGEIFNRDHQSIQRYAVVYKNCKLLQIPGTNSAWKRRLVPKAKAVSTVRVQIEEWAIILIVCWPLFLSLLVGLSRCFLRRQQMPQYVLGENDVGKHWFNDMRRRRKSLAEEEGPQVDEQHRCCSIWRGILGKFSEELFLSVDSGATEDFVTITRGPKHIRRSLEKPFAAVDF
ncbi:hypothetical protein FGB62_52g113 [Gracilaria domingensis]|nr:hypothetical protein FGB62_52g113 [Gracilaria domingensis]